MEKETIKLASVTALPTRSTVKLDLANPPERLNDEQLAEAERISREPLPDLPPVDPKFLAQCLRMMLAVLPRQNADDIAGELFVAAYKSHLGSFSREAIEYLTHRATGECKWFPTIAECREKLGDWRREDGAVLRRNQAQSLANREHRMRALDNYKPAKPPALQEITYDEIAKMTPAMLELGLSCGALVKTPDGRFVPT